MVTISFHDMLIYVEITHFVSKFKCVVPEMRKGMINNFHSNHFGEIF